VADHGIAYLVASRYLLARVQPHCAVGENPRLDLRLPSHDIFIFAAIEETGSGGNNV
jgi:hypothetical protein